MTNQSPKEEQMCRSEQRRQQVLDAAAECFRRYGFHGASISQISSQAGMSAGHIYHFFENKEAIVAAIVEREIEALKDLVDTFDRETDIFNTLIDGVDVGLAHKTRPQHAELWMEIWAETARNPEIAKIVRAGDDALKERFRELHARARRERGLTSAVGEDVANEVLMALFNGLSIRTILSPDFDRQQVAKLLRILVRTALEA